MITKQEFKGDNKGAKEVIRERGGEKKNSCQARPRVMSQVMSANPSHEIIGLMIRRPHVFDLLRTRMKQT